MTNYKFHLFFIVIVAGLFAACNQQGNKDQITDCNRKIAVTSVHNMATGLGSLFSGIADSLQRVEIAQKLVDPIRFYDDSSGYFYIDTYDGWNIAHGTTIKKMQGKNFWDYQDPHGLYVFRELTKLAKSGGGFLEYYWLNPNTKTQEKKLGYVEPIPGTSWYIGDGVYLNN